MSDPILVRGAISQTVAWSRTLVPLGVILGAILHWFVPQPTGLIVGGVFAIWWIILEIYVARQRRIQLWVRDTGDGMDLIDRKGERHLPDHRITSVSLKSEAVYTNGVMHSTKRVFTVWSDLEPEAIPFESRLKPKQTDPLALLIGRVLTDVQKRTEAALAAGEVLKGSGWQLDQEKLTWGKNEPLKSIARSEISACEEFDGHLCVWRKGHDECIVKFKLGTLNLCLLPLLLQFTTSGEVPAEEQTGLGRVLFERKPGAGSAWGLGCLGVLLLFVGGAVFVGSFGKPDGVTIGTVGIGVATVGLALAFWGYSMRYAAFRCHERGVVQLGLRSRKELKYEETGAFTYSATRHYHNGAYVGTAISMNFTPLAELKAPKIAYSTTVKNEDAAIEELRNYISRAIAGRMAKRIADGLDVPWTPNLTFTREGILYRPPGFIGRKDAKLLTYEQYGGCNLDQGIFYLFQKGEKKAVTNEQASSVNFYPGFFLLLMMQE